MATLNTIANTKSVLSTIATDTKDIDISIYSSTYDEKGVGIGALTSVNTSHHFSE